jgi:hypothetical protein
MKIEFSTDNDAFIGPYENDPISEKIYKERMIINILQNIIYQIEIDDKDHGSIMDINGNKIGEWSL